MITKAGAAELKRLSKEMDDLNAHMIQMSEDLKETKPNNRSKIRAIIYAYKDNRRLWTSKQDEVSALIGLEQWLKVSEQNDSDAKDTP